MYQCGPASPAGVMNYWNASITPDEIAKEIYSASAGGTLDSLIMVIYPQRKGCLQSSIQGDGRPQEAWDAGYPLVALVDYGFWVLQSNVYGYYRI